MVKKRGEGLPYLKTSLKFNFESSSGLQEEQVSYIKSKIVGILRPSFHKEKIPSPVHELHEFSTEQFHVGIQSVLDALSDRTVDCALFDSSCFNPSAVANIFGLYITNSDCQNVYVIPGLKSILKQCSLEAETIASGSLFPDIFAVVKTSGLVPVAIKNKQTPKKLVPTSIQKSIGKANKRKQR